jgi:hypothetical protein
MKRHIKIIALLLCLIFEYQAKADMWEDPTWKTMLEKSDLIVLVEYTSSGDFRVSAKILTTYKGILKSGDEIWISGFSNRYGPIDKANKGDKYLLFLNLNEPNKETVSNWNKQVKTKPELKEYVESYKAKKAYDVWSPTSGDLKIKEKTVQYDLTQTTFYPKQNYYSLEEFEQFLIAYNNKNNNAILVNELLLKITPVLENDLNCQYLMQLYLLNYNQYNPIFAEYVKVANPSTRYALAQLIGNVDSEQSRNILIAMLDDNNSIVQGEAVRQLKDGPEEIIAPILLKHLKTASGENFGPSNIMNPLTNRINGGKVEIIKALGELKYKPSIPDLLLILDTDNDDLFILVVEVLRNMGSREYISYINKHLDNKTYKLIYEISNMIVDDSLTECLPSFRNFISTCNRNIHPNYEYTISTCCGIGHFKDSVNISFLLSDYKHFFKYKDTLDNSKQKSWSNKYIETFTELKVKEARPLIYNSIFDWCGLNEDFGKTPRLYEVKRSLEDSLRSTFENNFQKRGFKLDHCIAFIENTSEIVKGVTPKVRFLIQVTIPSKKPSEGNEYLDLIAKELNLSKESVYIRLSDGVYFVSVQNRFDKGIIHTPLYNFIGFAKAVPNNSDITFLQGLIDSKFISDNYDQEKVKEAIKEIKATLKK